jgi:GT2 family glycosyltransferase
MDSFLEKKETLMKFSIIIPNWNGEKLLKENLPAVLKSNADQIVIIDNGSADGSVEFLKKLQDQYPQVKVIFNKINLGFARAVNQGVKIVDGEIVVLLNNDVCPETDFLKPLVKDFQDEKIFAVSLHESQASWAKGQWENGFINHYPGEKTKTTHLSFWASGGSGAFRKSIWLKLGGMDEIFAPFYWEDTDISYRAWKRGFKILWEPQSIVHHHHESTIGSRFSPKYIDFISQRNQLLFIWKNTTDFKMLLEHKMSLAKKLITKPGYWRPFWAAWAKFYLIFPRWLKEFKDKKVSDREIFKLFE